MKPYIYQVTFDDLMMVYIPIWRVHNEYIALILQGIVIFPRHRRLIKRKRSIGLRIDLRKMITHIFFVTRQQYCHSNKTDWREQRHARYVLAFAWKFFVSLRFLIVLPTSFLTNLEPARRLVHCPKRIGHVASSRSPSHLR